MVDIFDNSAVPFARCCHKNHYCIKFSAPQVPSAAEAAAIAEAAEKEVEAVGQSKEECEALLERLTTTQLHDGHSLAVDLKFNLIQVLEYNYRLRIQS